MECWRHTENWNKDMLLHHPSLIDACQEVIIVEGETWARFAAKFVRIESDGNVVFSVRDTRPAVLPATATSLPWLALAGFLSLFGGMVLMLRRWN